MKLGRFAAFRRAALRRAPVAHTKFVWQQDVTEVGKLQGPGAAYASLVAAGQLKQDPRQVSAVLELSALFDAVMRRDEALRGLYIHGTVGTGKSMLMDIFHACAVANGVAAERAHFHEFLQSVHKFLHRRKLAGLAGGEEALAALSDEIADRAAVLCFDELAITTIQDCCMLTPLFRRLWDRGVVVIATSNRAPEDLYAGGLNRHLHLPSFLAALHGNCDVLELTGSDHRVLKANAEAAAEPVFRWPLDGDSEAFVRSWFEKCAGVPSAELTSLPIAYGRTIQCEMANGVAKFSFANLCEDQLSVDDFLEITKQVHTLIVADIPRLSVDQHNEARRLTCLIDACYERHTRLIATLAVEPAAVLADLSGLQNLAPEESEVAAQDGDASGFAKIDGEPSGAALAAGRQLAGAFEPPAEP